jgi:hypothetical protein
VASTPAELEEKVGMPRRRGIPRLLLVITGAAAGVLTELAAHVPALLELTTYGGIWVCAAACIGYRSRRPTTAAWRASQFLLAMVLAFYATRGFLQGGDESRFVVFWIVLALVAGPVCGALGAVAPRPTWLGAGAVALLTGYLAGEALAVGLSARDRAALALVGFDACAAIITVVFAPANPRWRGRALLLLPVPIVLGTAVLGVIRILARLGGL